MSIDCEGVAVCYSGRTTPDKDRSGYHGAQGGDGDAGLAKRL